MWNFFYEFEDDIEFEEITSKYGLLTLRYKEQKCEKVGIVNVYLNFRLLHYKIRSLDHVFL